MVVAEVELGQVAVQVLALAVLVGADHAALERREVAFKGVGRAVATLPLVVPVVDGQVLRKALGDPPDTSWLRRWQVGHSTRRSG